MMRWIVNIFLLSASLWLSAAVAAPSPWSGAYVSNSRYVLGGTACPTLTLIDRHHKVLLNRLRQRRTERAGRRAIISPIAASVQGKSENDGITISSPKSIRRRRSWEESYALLCRYRDNHGHCNVPQSEKPLGPWVNRQRIEHSRYLLQRKIVANKGGAKKGEEGKLRGTSMTTQRKKLLDEIGFVWDAMGHTWSTRYSEL